MAKSGAAKARTGSIGTRRRRRKSGSRFTRRRTRGSWATGFSGRQGFHHDLLPDCVRNRNEWRGERVCPRVTGVRGPRHAPSGRTGDSHDVGGLFGGASGERADELRPRRPRVRLVDGGARGRGRAARCGTQSAEGARVANEWSLGRQAENSCDGPPNGRRPQTVEEQRWAKPIRSFWKRWHTACWRELVSTCCGFWPSRNG